MSGPLKGIRVLDLTRVLAGPFATQILADLGAEIIKVERPGTGDDTRGWGPPYVKDARGNDTSETTYFAGCNRGKKSVTLDLADADAQKRVRELAGQCDVLVENYKVGDLARYGLDYASLHILYPGLIYCSITGFGQTGPYAERAGYDPIAQAMCGLMSVTGEPDDMPGTKPQRVGVAVVDLMSGQYSVIGILAALLHRKQTGEGQHIDIGLLDVGVASMANIASAYLGAGVVSKRNGGVHPSVVPSQVFECADGYVIVAAANDVQFRKLCEAAGRAEIAQDERFATNSARVRNRSTIAPLLETIFRARPVADWTEALANVGVPCGPIHSIDRVFEDPQVKARGMVVEVPYAPAGKLKMVVSPIRLSATSLTSLSPPPLLGEHDQELGQKIKKLSLMPNEISPTRQPILATHVQQTLKDIQNLALGKNAQQLSTLIETTLAYVAGLEREFEYVSTTVSHPEFLHLAPTTQFAKLLSELEGTLGVYRHVNAWKLQQQLQDVVDGLNSRQFLRAFGATRNILEQAAIVMSLNHELGIRLNDVLQLTDSEIRKGEEVQSLDLIEGTAKTIAQGLSSVIAVFRKGRINWPSLASGSVGSILDEYEKVDPELRQINVLTAIDKLQFVISNDGQIPARFYYDFLSDVVHPNFGSNLMFVETRAEVGLFEWRQKFMFQPKSGIPDITTMLLVSVPICECAKILVNELESILQWQNRVGKLSREVRALRVIK